jgi:4,5-DOPA dioxygenase extradiol
MFISHGAPTFALEPGRLGAQLKEIGRSLDQVKAILVVSPHWQTTAIEVMTSPAPETIHDFNGFPASLYTLTYSVRGATAYAQKTMAALKEAGLGVVENATRGLDHGAWVPLRHLLPNAELPVFQVSMPISLRPQSAYAIGQVLGALRQEGVMVIASGSMTHNLRDFGQGVGSDLSYVGAFADWVKKAVQHDQLEQLFGYRELAPGAKRAHPTDEHFLPLFVALGARSRDDSLRTIEGGVEYGMLSMDSFGWGLATDADPSR